MLQVINCQWASHRSSVLRGHWTNITSSFLILCNLSLDRWLQREARNVTHSTPYHGLVIYLNASYTILPERWQNNENGKEICLQKTQWAPPENLLHWSARVTPKGENPSGCYVAWETTEKSVFYLLGWSSTGFGIGRQSIVNAVGWSQSKTQQPLKDTVPLRVSGGPLLPIRACAFMWRCHFIENQPWSVVVVVLWVLVPAKGGKTRTHRQQQGTEHFCWGLHRQRLGSFVQVAPTDCSGRIALEKVFSPSCLDCELCRSVILHRTQRALS